MSRLSPAVRQAAPSPANVNVAAVPIMAVVAAESVIVVPSVTVMVVPTATLLETELVTIMPVTRAAVVSTVMVVAPLAT
jgi:hypothetical protein